MLLTLEYMKIFLQAPLREGAVQIVLKSEQQHHKNLAICRSVCRVLANLAASFTDVTNSLLDTGLLTLCRLETPKRVPGIFLECAQTFL